VALVSFLTRPKPRMLFLGLSLLRNQTETLATLATQAIVSCNPVSTYNARENYCSLEGLGTRGTVIYLMIVRLPQPYAPYSGSERTFLGMR